MGTACSPHKGMWSTCPGELCLTLFNFGLVCTKHSWVCVLSSGIHTLLIYFCKFPTWCNLTIDFFFKGKWKQLRKDCMSWCNSKAATSWVITQPVGSCLSSVSVTGMLARWGGSADDSPEPWPSAWRGQRRKKKKTEEGKKQWQTEHSTHRWIGSREWKHLRWYLSSQIQLQWWGRVGEKTEREIKTTADNRSKTLQVHAEPRAAFVGEHNASEDLRGIQWLLMLPPKIPVSNKNICQGHSSRGRGGFTLKALQISKGEIDCSEVCNDRYTKAFTWWWLIRTWRKNMTALKNSWLVQKS